MYLDKLLKLFSQMERFTIQQHEILSDDEDDNFSFRLECNICYEETYVKVVCSQCNKTLCTYCYKKSKKKCPYCRHSYLNRKG